jgi:hypothetical protein
MTIAWGVVLVVSSLLAWGGQTVSWLAPDTATRLGLMESEDDVDETFWADIRGEAAWDTITLWTLPVAGILLLADQAAWPYFGLVGGGMYVYFAGRGVLVRREMMRRGRRIGAPASVRVGLVALAGWGLIGAITVVAATVALQS